MRRALTELRLADHEANVLLHRRALNPTSQSAAVTSARLAIGRFVPVCLITVSAVSINWLRVSRSVRDARPLDTNGPRSSKALLECFGQFVPWRERRGIGRVEEARVEGPLKRMWPFASDGQLMADTDRCGRGGVNDGLRTAQRSDVRGPTGDRDSPTCGARRPSGWFCCAAP